MSAGAASTDFRPGLEGVIAFETEIAEPDKDGGSLRYRGVDIEELVGRYPFENVWGLLVDEDINSPLPPTEAIHLQDPSGSVPADLQAALATLGPKWGMRKLVDINYMGTFYAARAALRVFRRQHHGHVVIISSIVGKRGVPYMGAYAATKFAQVGMAECLRAEVAGSPIHVSVVYPVSTESEFFDVMSRETGTAITHAFGPRQDTSIVADAIARAIERPVPEVFPHFQSRALVWLNTMAPGLCDRVVKRFGRKPVR